MSASPIWAARWNSPTRSSPHRSTSISARSTARREAVLPHMLRQGGGAIVNISSLAAIRWTGYPYFAYYATKAAVNQATVALAMQYARSGIRANCILPGLIDASSTSRSPVNTLPSTRWWRPAAPPCPWAAWEPPGTSPTPPCSSPPTRRSSSPACACRSTAGRAARSRSSAGGLSVLRRSRRSHRRWRKRPRRRVKPGHRPP